MLGSKSEKKLGILKLSDKLSILIKESVYCSKYYVMLCYILSVIYCYIVIMSYYIMLYFIILYILYTILYYIVLCSRMQFPAVSFNTMRSFALYFEAALVALCSSFLELCFPSCLFLTMYADHLMYRSKEEVCSSLECVVV